MSTYHILTSFKICYDVILCYKIIILSVVLILCIPSNNFIHEINQFSTQLETKWMLEANDTKI